MEKKVKKKQLNRNDGLKRKYLLFVILARKRKTSLWLLCRLSCSLAVLLSAFSFWSSIVSWENSIMALRSKLFEYYIDVFSVCFSLASFMFLSVNHLAMVCCHGFFYAALNCFPSFIICVSNKRMCYFVVAIAGYVFTWGSSMALKKYIFLAWCWLI